MYLLKILVFQTLFFFSFSETNPNNRSPNKNPGFIVTHYNCEKNEQKTLHKYAINQDTQCGSEPQSIETTKIKATLYSKARATTLTRYKITATFSEKKVPVQMEIKTD